MLKKIAQIGMIVASVASASVTLAQAQALTPQTTTVAQATPEPKATPSPFSWSGRLRAYDFARQNAYSGPNTKPNQQTFAAGLSLHGDYTFSDSGLSVGATYFYSNPFDGCASAQSHFPQATSNVCAGAGFSGNGNTVYQDDTLPGYELSTLDEAYLQYKGNGLYVKAGDQMGALTWAPSSDTRLKPSTYQGVDASYALNKQWALEVADFWEWECRTCGNFDHFTSLTDAPLYPYGGQSAGLPTTVYNPTQTQGISNDGVLVGRVGYTGPKSAPLTANLSYYAFDKIANFIWLDARMPFQGAIKPFLALQFGSESNATNYTVPTTNASSGILGNISSTVFGMQAGFNVLPNLVLQGSFDSIPWKQANIPASQVSGFSCGTNHQIALSKGVPNGTINIPYFLPTQGTAQCTLNGDGSVTVYYGGLASPYTTGYTSDPLYTTSLTQGMIERQSAGTSYKVQATFTSDDRRFVSYVSQAFFDYNNGGYAQGTNEFNFDTTYYFRPLPKTGGYHGFSFRYRYGNRDESTFVGSKAPGLFKYNRFQAQYDF